MRTKFEQFIHIIGPSRHFSANLGRKGQLLVHSLMIIEAMRNRAEDNGSVVTSISMTRWRITHPCFAQNQPTDWAISRPISTSSGIRHNWQWAHPELGTL
jgi:hypothetical protein